MLRSCFACLLGLRLQKRPAAFGLFDAISFVEVQVVQSAMQAVRGSL